jgi:hypothetical protein|tara:strand:- start:1340 stop:1840 length:501 start_codon:yes stop_codon:yes gene_type:complete
MKNKLIILAAIMAAPVLATATTPISGSVASKCVVVTDTDGVYGNPSATKLSTSASDGGVLPIIRYDIITASAYNARITTPISFTSSPSLEGDVVNWTGSTVANQMSDASMSAFNTDKIVYNNTSEFPLSVAGSVWFDVSSEATYGYNKAFPAGSYSAVVTAECIAQ